MGSRESIGRLLLPGTLLVLAVACWCIADVSLRHVRQREPRPAMTASVQDQVPLSLYEPVKPGSVRFAVIGDSGTGQKHQYQVATEMAAYRRNFPFDFVLMLGDNIYGGSTPEDFQVKFEEPYKSLLDAGVKFYASLGNHDSPNERFYKLFNMCGQRYYAFTKGNARFFALDSNYMNPEQLDWLQTQLQSSDSAWKICYFHHPLYSDGRAHGPDMDLRALLQPLFVKFGVNAVLSGHEHFYERIRPQKGIYYFILGNAGQLRRDNIRRSDEMQVGFDTDRAFMLVEIAGDKFYFQTISRTGETVDHGILQRQKASTSLAPDLVPSEDNRSPKVHGAFGIRPPGVGQLANRPELKQSSCRSAPFCAVSRFSLRPRSHRSPTREPLLKNLCGKTVVHA
jgi:hypothetical protein